MVHSLSPAEIKALRESVGMKQRELAHALGFSGATGRAWERTDKGHRAMSLQTIPAFRQIIESRRKQLDVDRASLAALLPRAA